MEKNNAEILSLKSINRRLTDEISEIDKAIVKMNNCKTRLTRESANLSDMVSNVTNFKGQRKNQFENGVHSDIKESVQRIVSSISSNITTLERETVSMKSTISSNNTKISNLENEGEN